MKKFVLTVTLVLLLTSCASTRPVLPSESDLPPETELPQESNIVTIDSKSKFMSYNITYDKEDRDNIYDNYIINSEDLSPDIPTMLFESCEALTRFSSELNNKRSSFEEYIVKYDDEFFNDNVLLMLIVVEGSGSIRHKVKESYVEGDTLHICVVQTSPPLTDDIGSWLGFVELKRSDFEEVEHYNIYLEYYKSPNEQE